jgi:DNA-binding GntR family transcriptional regulator
MHQAILDIAGHETVWQVIASVKAQLDRVRHLSLEDADWLAMIFRPHQDIIDRVATHDADGAAQAIQSHLRTVFAAVDRIAAAQPEFLERPAQPLPSRRKVA